jgi:hypothetical protein
MNRFRLAPLVLFFALPAVSQDKGKSKDGPPKPLYALKLAADPGKTTRLTLRGMRLDTATEVRVGEPKSSGKVVGKGRKVGLPNQQVTAEVVGDSELDVEVTLPAEVPGGVVPVTVVGPGGESAPMTVLVNDDTPRVAETEPNDGFKQAMPMALPQVVEASVRQNQDVDVYRLDVKAGDRLRIEVQARRAGSPVSPLLTLYDADYRTVATGEAADGDPALRWAATKDGTYFVSVQEGNDHGGAMFAYRLVVRAEK